jgi:hypothetical protein
MSDDLIQPDLFPELPPQPVPAPMPTPPPPAPEEDVDPEPEHAPETTDDTFPFDLEEPESVDDLGAERFCKRWGLPFPGEPLRATG